MYGEDERRSEGVIRTIRPKLSIRLSAHLKLALPRSYSLEER
jgi:hypothetical protein